VAVVGGRCSLIKHIDVGQHDAGPFKGLPKITVTLEKNVDLDKTTETVAKIQGVANLLIAGMKKKK
jgi:hypothetical protein